MNNVAYGKTVENMRQRIKIRVVKNKDDFNKYTLKPTGVHWKVFENKLTAIHEKKISLTLNKRIYVGFTILEISNWEMYNFHYDFMIRKFNIRILFTDTDSLCYELHEKNPYKKMYQHKKLIDLSNFSVNSKYYCNDNKNVVGKMKDEYGGTLIIKFVDLKPKMYSILDENNNEKSTNKGHYGFIEFKEFENTLFQRKNLRHTMRGIKSKNHSFGRYETNKTSISCFDDKRYILKNGIDTLAYGDKNILN